MLKQLSELKLQVREKTIVQGHVLKKGLVDQNFKILIDPVSRETVDPSQMGITEPPVRVCS